MNALATRLCIILVCTLIAATPASQHWSVAPSALGDAAQLARIVPGLAQQAIAAYNDNDRATYFDNLFRLQLVAGDYAGARSTIRSLQQLRAASNAPHANVLYAQYDIYAHAKTIQAGKNISFVDAFAQAFRSAYSDLSDMDALRVADALTRDPSLAKDDLQVELDALKRKNRIDLSDAVGLTAKYAPYQVYTTISPLAASLVREDGNRRYIISNDVLIKTADGATLSAIVVRKRGFNVRQPAALVFTIYADIAGDVQRAEYAAARGYAGVTAYTRGKASSPDAVVPYEYDGRDADSVIDWITKQPWSSGTVGMYGGSYNGFTQWAATKALPAALKTIVPYVANNPGNGLPMENNIFLFVNYAWAFYVTDNKYLDEAAYSDPARSSLNRRWYVSGKPYRDVDQIDGHPNPWLQRWLRHASYDAYWQAMVPFRQDFAKINIPVLTITGYYDDGQGSALKFLRDHYKYNPRADHYLLIGPYDHLGTQRAHKPDVLRGYAIDAVAQIDTPELTFDWLDYIMRGGAKPALLSDRINYEVMGANVWKHAASLDKMHNALLTLYLTARKTGHKYYQLSEKAQSRPGFLYQHVDFADRKTQNNDSYPDPILDKKPDLSNGFCFITPPFSKPFSIDGQFFGRLKAIINKRDMDVGLVLYEVLPNGKLFELSYFTGRASYATDMSARKLLTPGKIATIPFDRSRLVSRRIAKGSRLLLTLNVNKNQFAQINYGTGKDVSDEDIRDAKVQLKIKWLTGSYVKIPIWK